MDIKIKALKVIEMMCLHAEGDAILEDIYAYAHVALGGCVVEHKNWAEELEAAYKLLCEDEHPNKSAVVEKVDYHGRI